jgi:hypothetical protein
MATALWKLRRISSRVIRVFDRHKEAEPAFAAFEPTLVPAAEGFNDAYGKVRAHRVSRAKTLGFSLISAGTLLRKLRGWLGPVAKDIPGFDPSSFGDTPTVADDVIHDTEEFLRVVEQAIEEGVQLAYAEALRADLEPAIEAAKAESGVAGTVQAHEAALIKTMHDAAATLQAELIAFRRTLRAHFGTSHPDYQKLRASKASAPDQDDDEVAASLPDEQEAALESNGDQATDEADLAEAS